MKNLVALLGAAALTSLCTPAFAGHWEIHYETDGAIYESRDDSRKTPWPATITSQSFSTGGALQPPAIDSTPPRNAARLDGKIRAVLQWTADSAQDTAPPPSTVATKETGSVWAHGDEIYRYSGTGDWWDMENWVLATPDVSLSNSLGGTLTTSGTGGTLTKSQAANLLGTWAVPTSGTVVLPFRTFSAAALVPADIVMQEFCDGADLEASVLYKAEIDTRSVELSRSGAPTPLREVTPGFTADGTPIVPAIDEWVGIDGTAHGHTLASYKLRSGGVGGKSDDEVPMAAWINANKGGSWSNLTTYSWTKSINDTTYEPDDGIIYYEDGDAQKRFMPLSDAIYNPDGLSAPWLPDNSLFALPPGWINVPSDKKGHSILFQYGLTDLTDQAKSISQYNLTLHDVWENPMLDDRFHPTDDTTGIYPGITWEKDYYVPGGAQSITKGGESKWTIGQASSFDVEFSADFKGGFKIGDWADVGGSSTVKQTLTYSQSMESTAPNINTAAEYSNFSPSVWYKAVVIYDAKRVHRLLDHFGESGFLPDSTTMVPYAKTNPIWGRTPQSKVEDLSGPSAGWFPYTLGQTPPADNSSGIWTLSGSVF